MNFIHRNIQLPPIESVTTETGRRYVTPDGKVYPSVTTVLGWSKRKIIEGWTEKVGQERADQIKTQAGVRGTAVHDIAERYINNDPTWKNAMPVNLYTFMPVKKILDDNLSEVLAQEVGLWSDHLETAGRTDVIGIWKGKRSVIDFKTSLKMKDYEKAKSYFQQEAFYAVAFEERTGLPIKNLVTIMMVDHENPIVFEENRDNHIGDFIKIREQYREEFGI